MHSSLAVLGRGVLALQKQRTAHKSVPQSHANASRAAQCGAGEAWQPSRRAAVLTPLLSLGEWRNAGK